MGIVYQFEAAVYNWTNETTVVKQSAASFFALIFGIIVSIPFVGLIFFVGNVSVGVLGVAEAVGMFLIAAGLWSYCRRVEF